MADPGGGAVFDASRHYRYRLWRQWGDGPRCLFVMLNSSKADEAENDPTIRRCIGYAKLWGYGALDVCNLFALVATDPRELWRAVCRGQDPVGERNDSVIYEAACAASIVVAAWGVRGELLDRWRTVTDQLVAAAGAVYCLGLTARGQPRHPLYMRAAQSVRLFSGRDDAPRLTREAAR